MITPTIVLSQQKLAVQTFQFLLSLLTIYISEATFAHKIASYSFRIYT